MYVCECMFIHVHLFYILSDCVCFMDFDRTGIYFEAL